MGLQFIIEWEPRWQSFCSAVAVVVRPGQRGAAHDHIRMGARLRTPAASIAAHVLLLCLAVEFGGRAWSRLQHHDPALRNPFDHYIVYYVPQGLPNLSDAGGEQQGQSGLRGGSHKLNEAQVIRVARGTAPAEMVADAPQLKLPATKDAPNLIALLRGAPQKFLPASPDVSGLHTEAPKIPAPDVVAPAPRVEALRASAAPALPVAVVPPPPNVASVRGHNAAADVPQLAVVPPPPAVSDLRTEQMHLPAPSVVPPTPEIAGVRTSAGPMTQVAVVAPPPRAETARHRAIAPMAADPALAATANGYARAGAGGGNGGVPQGTTQASGIVVGGAGNAVGIPDTAKPGMLAMSPRDAGRAGVGGTGDSAGAGTGPGSGTASRGKGSGSASRGTGVGSSPTAVGGISIAAGPGGAGAGTAPRSSTGIVISGGIVDIPSFGSSGDLRMPRAGPKDTTQAPAVVIIATSRSGGGLGDYGVWHGARVYTTYFDTSRGTVVLQYADPASGNAGDFDLTPPRPVRTVIPGSGKLLRAVVSCVLDRTGAVKQVRVLEAATPQLASAMMRYLSGWRFRPALRGAAAVEVHAVLGFGISTE